MGGRDASEFVEDMSQPACPKVGPTSPPMRVKVGKPAYMPTLRTLSQALAQGDMKEGEALIDDRPASMRGGPIPNDGHTPNVETSPVGALLPSNPGERKQFPVASGVMDYFPAALVAISELSRIGNDQHNPGEPLHWARGKSTDEADTMIRHFLERGSRDADGVRHSVKMAWRALALLQKELEAEGYPRARGAY
jgi:dATP/dGTP diphosphohydrolase